jgi:hypothetical protein
MERADDSLIKTAPAEVRRDPKHLLFAATLGIAAAVTLWFIYLFVPLPNWLAADFKVFWIAGRLSDPLVYDPSAVTAALRTMIETDLRPFISPPTFLLAIEPFARMPLWPAFVLWTSIGLGLFFAASYRAAGKASLLAILAAPAFHWAAMVGQVTLIVGGFTYYGALLLSRRPVAAGLLFACAALLKPQAALMVPVALVAGGHFRALAAAAVGGGVAAGLSILLQGPDLWAAWLNAIGEFMQLIRANGFIANGITPAALAHSEGTRGAAEATIVAAGALLGLGCCWQAFRRSDDPALRGGALVCGSLLCTPYALPYEAASLVPAAAALLTMPKARWASLPAAAAICFPFSPLTVGFLALALLWAVSNQPRAANPSSSPAL